MSKMHVITAVATLGLMASATAYAQQPARYGAPWQGSFWGHVGVSGGESKFRRECRDANVFNCDRRDTAWKVYAGGRMNETLGMEIGYTDFGTIRASGGQTEAGAIPITLTAGLPLGPVNVFGKVGGLYGRTDVDASPTTLLDRGHKSGWGWTYGAGASFNVSQNLAIRADWDRYKLDFVGGRDDIDMLSAGIQFRF